jgi:hypothetical protein
MAAKLKSSQWSDFSDRVVHICRLPKGTALRLYRKSDDRRVRSDLSVKRKLVTSANIRSLNDYDTVSDFLSKIRMLLSTNIEARGLEMRLYGPDGGRIYGNTRIRTVKQMEPSVVKDDSEIFETFLDLLETAGLDDISLRQAGGLYSKLREIVGDELDKRLLRSKTLLTQ